MNWRTLLVGPFFLALSAQSARAQEEAPSITPWRYDEDYSYLGQGKGSGAWWEAYKWVPLDAAGNVRLSVGAELRAKYESYSNEVWESSTETDHDYIWLRALPYADLRLGDRARVFTEFIAAFEIGDEAPTFGIDENRADVLQAFGDVYVPVGDLDLTLRGGRRVLTFGSGRLVSSRYGPNVLLTFDGVGATVDSEAWSLEALYARPVDNEPGEFDDSTSDTESLWTTYFTHELPRWAENGGVDLYYMGYENDEATFNQGGGEETRHTLGARFFGDDSGWDWNAEAFGQFGEFADGDIFAWSVGTDSGYTFEDALFRPRLGIKANIISGDDDPTDSDLETFNPLFPNGKYFGEVGIIGPQNLINLHPSLELELSPEWRLGLASAFYWRESLGDGVYNNGGALIRASSGSDERYIGTQFDLAAEYSPHRNFSMGFSYSALTAGGFIEDTGSDETVHFFTVECRFLF